MQSSIYTHRVNQSSIDAAFANPFITAILGPRRVGKTTLIKHYQACHSENTWVMFNMDYLHERRKVQQEALGQMIVESAKYHIGAGKKIWVVIDEAQKCTELFDQIKILYDQYKDQNALKFILTGSASLNLHNLCAESLAGRIELFFLNEFTLHEATALQEGVALPDSSTLNALLDNDPIPLLESELHKLTPFRPLLEKQLNDHLIWGGLPEVLVAKDEAAKLRYLNNYLQTYIEKDIRALETISDLHLFQQLMDILAEQTGSVREDNNLLQNLGCSRDTLKKYRGILYATLMYTELYPFIGSTLKRVIKSPKGYIRNNGLISTLTGLQNLQILQTLRRYRSPFRKLVFGRINDWLHHQPQRNELYYWRTAAGAEIDFVVSIKPFIYPFEVTFGEQYDRKKANNLANFIKNEPSAHWGFYIYRGPLQIDQQRKICFLPAWAVG